MVLNPIRTVVYCSYSVSWATSDVWHPHRFITKCMDVANYVAAREIRAGKANVIITPYRSSFNLVGQRPF